jgi:hypothetical protein
MARSNHLAELFRRPSLVAHRNYEICRAYFLERASAEQLAALYSLSVASVRSVVRDFAAGPDPAGFFVDRRPGPTCAPKRDALEQAAVRLRREGLPLEEICQRLHQQGHEVNEAYLYRILQSHGLAGPGTPRVRRQVPPQARDGSEVPPVADVRCCSFQPGRSLSTKAAGLFLFVPLLLQLGFPGACRQARWPGSEMVPGLQAILALLVGKLLGKRRASHIDDLCDDEGAGLFCGLNVLPKATFATDYSYRTEAAMSGRFVKALLANSCVAQCPACFNLDFHAIAYRGEDGELEKHWLAKRNRAGTSIMAFVAQQRGSRVMCYATADVLRDDMDAMAVRFADHWKEQTGNYPEQVLFDGRVTTYEGLAQLETRRVGFITVRRRGCGMLRRVEQLDSNAWRGCQVSQAKGQQRTIQYVDEEVTLDGYPGKTRQIIVRGLGREEPTFFLTNNRPERQTARQVVQRYAQRNLIENGLGEQISFFHLDCLSSAVRLNVEFDLTLTLVADLLYRELARRLKGFGQASPQRLFRKFIDTAGSVAVEEGRVRVRLSKRAHNPVLKQAGLAGLTAAVPWLGGRPLLLDLP